MYFRNFIKELFNKNKNEIKIALYQNSKNLKNSYLYICNPLKNNNHLIIETYDNIIQILKDLKYLQYKQLSYYNI